MTVDDVVAAAGADPPVLVSGRYLLGPLLGRGGAAEVYQAHDQVVDRPVAVKIFLPGVVATDSRRQHREIKTLAGFSHPGLVMVYDAGLTGGRAFFVMQLVAGRTLADRLLEGPIPAEQVIELGIILADTLAYVHEHGVVHRDVKPANVLLDQHDHPHLSDFGIATVIDSTQITSTGMMIGTAAYLAPEQVRGHPIGISTDIFALGLLLLECLTGRREYPGTPMETALARLHRPPTIPEELPAPLPDLLVAMTADNPNERPAATEVAGWLQHKAPPTAMISALPPPRPVEPTVATAPRDSPAPAPWCGRRRRALLVGAVLLALALGSVLSLPLLTFPRTATAPVPSVSPTLSPSPSPTTPTSESLPTSGPTAEQTAPPESPAVTSEVLIPTAPAAVSARPSSRSPVQPSKPATTSPSLLLSTTDAPSPLPGTTAPEPQPTPPSSPVATPTTSNPQPTSPRGTTTTGRPPSGNGPPTAGA